MPPEPPPHSPLRAARRRAGLSQADLARAAGVSRQLVSSVEAGRHAPAVDAAIRIARALGTGVEELFGSPAAPPETPRLVGAARPGDIVRLARVGDRLVAARAEASSGWPAGDGVVGAGGEVRPVAGARPADALVVGCDPALGVCEALLTRPGRRLLAAAGSSRTARAALASGDAHAGVVHGPAGALPDPPGPVLRIHLARWSVGIAAESRAPALDAVLGGTLPLVQREAGAASQDALARAARAAGASTPPAAAVAAGHLDAARRARLTGIAALTFAPAAHREGLRFTPLEEHAVELWVDVRLVDAPAVAALLDLVASRTFRSRIALVGGYDLAGCGEPVAA